jgi:hypothetical protein
VQAKDQRQNNPNLEDGSTSLMVESPAQSLKRRKGSFGQLSSLIKYKEPDSGEVYD